MVPVEFQARVENGIIVVPDEYKQSLADVNTVKVIVLKQAQKQVPRPDIMDELAQNPVKVDRFLTRDEIHDRSL
ncbi:MAG: hypothetical protein KME27_11230 [Lyngbya sp. HA4199-MV5]|jgi:hypothetical protein|nr:hypothetical protein [Lyngbya sp. HA4199-MV5]